MKKITHLKRRDTEGNSSPLLARLDDVLQSTHPKVREWLEAQIQANLAQAPFLEASLMAPLPHPKEIPPNRMLTSHEAGKILNVPLRWIYRHKHKIPH